MLVLKILITALFCGVFFFLIHTVVGVVCSRKDEGKDELASSAHKKWLKISLGLTVVTVILVETMVRIGGGLRDKNFFHIHLVFAIAYLVLLIALLCYRNVRRPHIYRALLYSCFGAYVATFITGMVLLYYF